MFSLFKTYKTPSDEKLFDNIYRDGLKIDHDIIKRAHEEDGEALYLIGWDYFQRNTKTNHLKAKDWFLKSCSQHYAAAQYSMGFMYQKGFGVDPDHYKALDYFTMAANQGQENAKKQVQELNKAGFYLNSEKSHGNIEEEKYEQNGQLKKHKSKSKKHEQIKTVFEDQKKELRHLQEQLEAERKQRDKEHTELEKEKEDMAKRVKLLERLVTQLAIEKKIISEQDEKEEEVKKHEVHVNTEKTNSIESYEHKKPEEDVWADFQIR